MAVTTALPQVARSPSRAAAERSHRGWRLVTSGVIVLDASALGAAFLLAYVLRFKAGLPFLETPPHRLAFYTSVALWVIPAWLGLFALYRLYDRRRLFAGSGEYIGVINASTCGVMTTIFISFVDSTLQISRGWLLLVWVLSILMVGNCRFALRRFLRHLRAKGMLQVPTIIVGANEEGLALAEQLTGNPESGIRVIGFVDNAFERGLSAAGSLPVLGTLADLEHLIRGYGISEIIVATSAVARGELLDLYQAFGHVDGIEIRLSSGLFEILTTSVSVQEIGFIPLMTPHKVRIMGVDAVLKMVLDYVVAVLGLIACSPLLLVIALLIKLDSPGPVLHRRRVLGRCGKPLDALKFRTMVVNADEVLARNPRLYEAFHQGHKLKADPRVTSVGRWLRQASLDELPQLINVLRGEMSLVGPRMITAEEAFRYGKWQLNLLTVKPGITGPWQVRGRSDIPYDERVRLSMNYIRNYTVWSDLEILLRTIPAVVQSRGAY